MRRAGLGGIGGIAATEAGRLRMTPTDDREEENR